LKSWNRLPHNNALNERAHQLLPLSMTVLRADNEDNACTAIHNIFDLHKNYRPTLETEVQPLLDFVFQPYAGFKQTVSNAFPTALTAPPSPGFILIYTIVHHCRNTPLLAVVTSTADELTSFVYNALFLGCGISVAEDNRGI
jgi:mannitol-specific phosphotransferase system IIBC component